MLWTSLLLIIPVSPVLCLELQPQISQIGSEQSYCNSMAMNNRHCTATNNCCDDCNCVKSVPNKTVKYYPVTQQDYLNLDKMVQAYPQPTAVISFMGKVLPKDLFKPNIVQTNTLRALRTVILLN